MAFRSSSPIFVGAAICPSVKALPMRLFMFTSQAKDDLHAFAGDESGSKLPGKYAPWGLTGTLGSREAPPHKFSRKAIEQAISSEGFQLWRMKPKG
ncbi:hypothetical protein [Microvirga tunisiensis]|jgi:hypothetical protein|nr:hypothetical protein [Microvirga tunisiensis]